MRFARHGAERMSQGILAQLGGVAIGAATGSQAYVDLYSQVSHARRDPALLAHPGDEADEIGLMLMAEAGYDPRRGDRAVAEFRGAGRRTPARVPLDPPGRGHAHRTP